MVLTQQSLNKLIGIRDTATCATSEILLRLQNATDACRQTGGETQHALVMEKDARLIYKKKHTSRIRIKRNSPLRVRRRQQIQILLVCAGLGCAESRMRLGGHRTA